MNISVCIDSQYWCFELSILYDGHNTVNRAILYVDWSCYNLQCHSLHDRYGYFYHRMLNVT